MDAYDVLLSPAARFISQVWIESLFYIYEYKFECSFVSIWYQYQTLATFDTPIVFCGEHGIYPNYISKINYVTVKQSMLTMCYLAASFDRRNDEDPLTYGVMNATGINFHC